VTVARLRDWPRGAPEIELTAGEIASGPEQKRTPDGKRPTVETDESGTGNEPDGWIRDSADAV
jgi:hypothetical protein